MTRVVLVALVVSLLGARFAITAEPAEKKAEGAAEESAQESAQQTARESGVALKPADIRPEPFRDAVPTGSLEPGDEVDILDRAGGWYRVNVDDNSGWVRMLSIRRGKPRTAALDVEGILSLASGRAGTGHVVATTGIRGLSEEDLKMAEFDEMDLEALESFVVTPTQARDFAAKGNLVARKFDSLPVPQNGKEKEVWWPR